MVSRDGNQLVIWPQYFDIVLTRQQGRRVPKKMAVEKPSIEGIVKAAKSLHLHPVIENNAAHPSKSWKQKGRVLVDAKEPKATIILQIAQRL